MKTQVKAQAIARLGLVSILLAATLWGTVGVVIQALRVYLYKMLPNLASKIP